LFRYSRSTFEKFLMANPFDPLADESASLAEADLMGGEDDGEDILVDSDEEEDDEQDKSIPLNEESLRPPVRMDQHRQEEEEGPASPPPRAASAASASAVSDAGASYNLGAANNAKGKECRAGQSASAASYGGGSLADFGFGGLRGGFALKNYEEELGRLKKDNLQLKLRIYLLEEKHGLLPRSGEKEENVFRINLDLRVENKAMKEELEGKSKLLLTAYQAMEQHERELLREREEYESRIESLRQSLMESQSQSYSKQGYSVYPSDGSVSVAKQNDIDVEALELEAIKLRAERDELKENMEEMAKETEAAEDKLRSLERQVKEAEVKADFLSEQLRQKDAENTDSLSKAKEETLDLKREHLERLEEVEMRLLEEQKRRAGAERHSSEMLDK